MLRLACAALLLTPAWAAGRDPYAPAVERLTALVERQVREKNLPAVSIALVDDQRVVWSKGFGFQDRGRTVPVTDRTVFRVGSGRCRNCSPTWR